MHIGDKWLSHCKYIFKMRVESADSLRLIELGSRMRSQTRLSVNVHEKKVCFAFALVDVELESIGH